MLYCYFYPTLQLFSVISKTNLQRLLYSFKIYIHQNYYIRYTYIVITDFIFVAFLYFISILLHVVILITFLYIFLFSNICILSETIKFLQNIQYLIVINYNQSNYYKFTNWICSLLVINSSVATYCWTRSRYRREM